MSDEVPVACCLSDEELRNREATLLAQFKSAVVATEQLADGYAFQVDGDPRRRFPDSNGRGSCHRQRSGLPQGTRVCCLARARTQVTYQRR